MKTAVAVRPKTAAVIVKDAYKIEMTPVALTRLTEIQQGIDAAALLVRDAMKVKIKDVESDLEGKDLVVKMAKTAKFMEDLRKFFGGPLNERKKMVDEKFAEWIADLKNEEKRLRDEAGAFFMKQRDEAAAKERQRLKEEVDHANKARALGRAAPKPLPAAPVEMPAASTKTEAGSLNIRTEWWFDPAKVVLADVPRQYLMLNPKLVYNAIDGGERKIPGIVIEERTISSAR